MSGDCARMAAVRCLTHMLLSSCALIFFTWPGVIGRQLYILRSYVLGSLQAAHTARSVSGSPFDPPSSFTKQSRPAASPRRAWCVWPAYPVYPRLLPPPLSLSFCGQLCPHRLTLLPKHHAALPEGREFPLLKVLPGVVLLPRLPDGTLALAQAHVQRQLER